MIKRLVPAAVAAGVVLSGLATATATAAPDCADVHVIGAAGSGQRNAMSMATQEGMGDVVYSSYQQLRSDLVKAGYTVTSESVNYPAVEVPEDGSIGGWMGFMDSVRAGAAATGAQYQAYVTKCPTSKVVLAGYSQGAMAVHRNLHGLATSPQLAGALLIADGDRNPTDTTIKMGTTALIAPGETMGVGHEHYILAGTNTDPLPADLGARTISVCDVGDPVCDYDVDGDEATPAQIAIHTGYKPTAGGPHGWNAPLYNLVVAAAGTPSGAPVGAEDEAEEPAATPGLTLTQLAAN
ncbi:cutinase family protein [Mycolicibacterium brumae]|uniref:Cutinase family protein n=1 Tax=Mycolicibacterium brumae TaxID=85968 RepID=A0A2G5PG08_9MYCO|nr:cutinase family protein [Mycolicibacterium brumae]MCV7194365.1 cutinase family protein [Mycolicibacterium brumae]PIB77237.1 cutinase family protein [Mycolicibacterium brumae]RWA15484.1 hypothetical protein MBRU_10565 [Mycolicibacterium brumae DSM 44177]UWW10597.1 cutinase family protein [Mycolicibacterium brumae]